MNQRKARLIEMIYGYPSKLIRYSFKIRSFVVVEHVNPRKGTSYLYLAKKPSGVEFLSYIKEIRRTLGNVNYAGIKDRVALAYFHFSSDREVQGHEDIWLIGRSEKVSSRHNTGNTFRINVTVETSSKTELDEAKKKLCDRKEHVYMANFYGYQRFGLKRPVNHLIGKALIETRYHEAWYHALSMHRENLLPPMEAAMYKYALNKLSIVPHYDKEIRDLVAESYTSYFFNRSLTLYLQTRKLEPYLTYNKLSSLEGLVSREIPCGKKIVPGFYFESSLIKELEKSVGGREYAKPRTGLYLNRPVFIPVCNYSCSESSGREFALFFTLPKGSYATTLLLVKGFWLD